MAKRKRGPAPMVGAQLRETLPVPEGTIAFDQLPEDEAPDELLEEVLTRLEGSSEAFCIVSGFKMLNGQRREQWLFECAPTPNIESEIQRAYGEGDYRLRIYQRRVASDGVRRPLLVKNVVLPIGPSREPAAPLATTPGASASAPPPADRVAELIVEMRAANERATERQMQFMTEMVKALATNNNKGSSMAEFKDFAAGLGALPKQEKPKDPLELLGALWALVEKVRGPAAPLPVNEDGEVPPTTLFLEGIRTVRELVSNARGAQAAQAIPNHAGPAAQAVEIPAASLPVPIAQPIPNQPITPNDAPENDDMKMIQLYIRSLVKNARAKAPVEDYAGQVYSLLTDEALATIQGETWFDALGAIEPIPADLKPWFAELRAAVLTYVAEESAGPEPDAKPKVGDIQNAPGNAAASAKPKVAAA